MMVLAIGLNTRSTWRFNARMMLMRANIVGPPNGRNQDQGFHCSLPLCGLVLGKLGDVVAGVPKGDEAATARQR